MKDGCVTCDLHPGSMCAGVCVVPDLTGTEQHHAGTDGTDRRLLQRAEAELGANILQV